MVNQGRVNYILVFNEVVVLKIQNRNFYKYQFNTLSGIRWYLTQIVFEVVVLRFEISCVTGKENPHYGLGAGFKETYVILYITIIRALPINHAAVIFSIKVSKIANPSYLLLKFNTMK